MSAERSARSVSETDKVDKVRALQRVLYRSAKQDPRRRFHAVYDKVARSDILWRAWGDVRANRGAPGVDGLTIAAVEESGVAAFLDEIAAALKERSYRPARLRRVRIPKPGRAGETRPLRIPTLRDRAAILAPLGLQLRPAKTRVVCLTRGAEAWPNSASKDVRRFSKIFFAWIFTRAPRPCSVGNPRAAGPNGNRRMKPWLANQNRFFVGTWFECLPPHRAPRHGSLCPLGARPRSREGDNDPIPGKPV